MTGTTASQAFVDAVAAVVQQNDVADILARLLDTCADLTSAAAIGLLVKDGHGRLDILSTTSHQAAELELYQLQHEAGPCVDTALSGTVASASTDSDILARWDKVGAAILAAGFHAVHAVPLRWHGQLLGAMNAFHVDPATVTDETQHLTQAFADIATVVIVQSTPLTTSDLDERVRTVLAGRTVIEQAKGVLAHTAGTDMATAYQLLVQHAREHNSSLTDAAVHIIEQARRRP